MIIGIDPGLTGGVAFLYDSGSIGVWDMPVCDGEVDPYALTALIIEAGPVECVAVEAVHALHGSAAGNTFRFGQGFGTIIGILAALQRPVVRVAPTKWTKAIGVGADKDAHRRRCMELWPEDAHFFTRKKDDGRADAALIAWHVGIERSVMGLRR